MLKALDGRTKFLFGKVLSWPCWPWAVRTRLLRRLGLKISTSALIGHGFDIVHNIEYLTIEDDVYINSYAYIQVTAPVKICEKTRIGPHFRLITTLHPYRHSVIRRGHGGDSYLPTTIGRGCALGIGVTVLPGASIAEGCVIAAGSVVTKPTLPNGLYAGVPARRVKDLSLEDDEVAP